MVHILHIYVKARASLCQILANRNLSLASLVHAITAPSRERPFDPDRDWSREQVFDPDTEWGRFLAAVDAWLSTARP